MPLPGDTNFRAPENRRIPHRNNFEQPITKITRQLDGFHHGLLKATTHGHPVYVIHLHPSNWKTRIQEIDTIVKLTEKNAIILGDFNTFSKRDKPAYDSGQLVPFFSNRDKAMERRI